MTCTIKFNSEKFSIRFLRSISLILFILISGYVNSGCSKDDEADELGYSSSEIIKVLESDNGRWEVYVNGKRVSRMYFKNGKTNGFWHGADESQYEEYSVRNGCLLNDNVLEGGIRLLSISTTEFTGYRIGDPDDFVHASKDFIER